MDLHSNKYSIEELKYEKFSPGENKTVFTRFFIESVYMQNAAGRWLVNVVLSAKRRYITLLNLNSEGDILELDFSDRCFSPTANKYQGTVTIDIFTITIDDNWDYNIFLLLLMHADKLFLSGHHEKVLPLNCEEYICNDISGQTNTTIRLENIFIRKYDKYNDSIYIIKADALFCVYDADTGQSVPFQKFWTDSDSCWIQIHLSNVRFFSEDMKIYDRKDNYELCFFHLDNEPFLGYNAARNRVYLLENPERIGGYSFECCNEKQCHLLANWFSAILSSKNVSFATLDDSRPSTDIPVQSETKSSAFEELERLIGLENIKIDVRELINFAKVQKSRRDRGLKAVPVSLHLVFTGNPGTGKTSVARILAKLYKEIGILSSGQLIEVDRADLVAGYVGQTAIKTQEKIKEAMGGILFIDEAYTLAKDGNDFGQEAIDTILKAMEDNRDQFIVIVAGYSEPMEKFINSNPGLKSRFNKYIFFPDYSADELYDIFLSMCKRFDYILESEVHRHLQVYFNHLVENKGENFANARDVRNLFENIITNQASRIASMSGISDSEMMTISIDDIQNTISHG